MRGGDTHYLRPRHRASPEATMICNNILEAMGHTPIPRELNREEYMRLHYN